MSQPHPDTIGTIEHCGVTYEIDWPHDLDDETRLDPYLAVVYLNGDHLADLPLPGVGEPFTSTQQVMAIAHEFILSDGATKETDQ